MALTKNIIWKQSGFIIVFILVNAAIIKIGNTNNGKLFFGLLITLDFLVLALYFIRRKKHVVLPNYSFSDKDGQSGVYQAQGVSHFINPVGIPEDDLKVLIGNSRCRQPYHSSILNTTAMDCHALNKLFVPPATHKPELFNIDKHIHEDEISKYCLNAEDIVWQIGPEYLGCRKESGKFTAAKFKENALRPEVKMIELKLSDASGSGYYSVLPGVSAGIKNKLPESTVVPPSGHTSFRCAEGMIHFVGKLQDLSGGKPVGLKLFIGDKKEFYEICYAICKTQIFPDFFVIEGSEDLSGDGTTAIAGDGGMPLYEALLFVSKTLRHYGLDKEIKIIASGKIVSGIDMLKMIALGADAVCAHVPGYTMNAFQNIYVEKFRNDTFKAMVDIMKTCGFKSLNDITLTKLFRRLDMLPLITAEKSYNQKANMGAIKTMDHSKLKMKGDVFKKQAAVL